MQPDILVTAPLPPFLYEPLKADYRCHDYYQSSHKPGLLAAEGARVRGLVQGGGTLTPTELLDKLPKLEIISVFGVGYDGVPVAYCKQRGLKVTNTPDVLTDDVADVALGLILMTGRGFVRLNRFVQAGEWEKRGPELTAKLGGRKVGVLGLGRIGKAIAQRVAAMGMKVAYTGRKPQDVPYEYMSDLRSLAAAVDFLVVACPGGPATKNIVDSGVLAALAAQETPEPVHTFTIGFGERSFDERADARLVAERYGTAHHELLVQPDPEQLLQALAEAFDEPFADSSALPTYLVSQLAAEDVKVALSGEGGDELFGGYYTYAADLLAERVGGLARIARPFVERLPTSTAKASFDYRAKRFVRAAHLPPLERHHGWKEVFSPAARAELTGGSSSFDPVDLLRSRYDETTGTDELARLQDVDLGVYLVDDLLVKTDRASMAHSLEARVPYLDTVVTNLALALPTRQKLRGFTKKVLLRKAAEPLLPRGIVRGKKRGFSIPAAAWLRGELEPFARETLSAETLRRQGFFRPEAVNRLLDSHVAGREDLSRQLWGLLAFTLWHERHVERRPSRSRMPELLAER